MSWMYTEGSQSSLGKLLIMEAKCLHLHFLKGTCSMYVVLLFSCILVRGSYLNFSVKNFCC